jgi:hypothetical protein
MHDDRRTIEAESEAKRIMSIPFIGLTIEELQKLLDQANRINISFLSGTIKQNLITKRKNILAEINKKK